MNKEPLWVEPSELISPQEVQIGAQDTCPVVNGKCLRYISWYRVEPGKVTICFFHDEKEQIQEFDAREVSLSGYASERYSAKNAKESEFNPLLGSAEIWGYDDFYIRGAISDAAQPLLEYMQAHYPDHETVLQLDMTGRIIVYQPNVPRPNVSHKTVSSQQDPSGNLKERCHSFRCATDEARQSFSQHKQDMEPDIPSEAHL